MKPFAPGYKRTEEGWIIFPKDHEIRLQWFPPEVMRHPAKANIHMIDAIVDMVSSEGDTILDPMSGTGTIMLQALRGRRVYCVEVEEGYHTLQKQALATLEAMRPDIRGRVMLIHADCRRVLPLPCDHIIFSPPYGTALKAVGPGSLKTGTYDGFMGDYSKDPSNVGNVNRFFHNQAMEKVYGLCYESLRPGGTMTVIIRDQMEQGKRVYLSKWMERVCLRAGFDVVAWNKRYQTSTAFKEVLRVRGYGIVTDEDIVTFRRA